MMLLFHVDDLKSSHTDEESMMNSINGSKRTMENMEK
jgi:hypothetical protein